MSSFSDGGRIRSTGLRIFISKGAGTLLVRMTEPNPITSHDWHVQPICQRSLRVVRLSGTPMDRGPDFHPAVLELGAHRPNFSATKADTGVFCANLLKLSKSRSRVKQRIRLNNREPLWITVRAAQKIKERPAKMARVRFSELAGDELPGHAMACSL